MEHLLMPVRTKSLATIAAALAIALAAPAAFAADQMSNSQASGTGTMTKGMDSNKMHSGNDAMSHATKDKMSGSSQTMSNPSGDNAMSHDKK
jgi:hypothetical protein